MKERVPRPFAVLWQTEVRRLWRSPLAWLFVAAPPALFVLVGHWQASALERHLRFLLYASLLWVGYSAFVAWVGQRDRRTATDEVILAWPISSRWLYLARTLALGSLTLALWLEAALPELAYAAFSYGTAARAAALPIPLAEAARNGGLIALSLAASLLGAQMLGQLAAALLPGPAALVALLLFGAFAIVGQRAVAITLQWPYGLLASPQFMWDNWVNLADGLYANLCTDLYVAHQGFWVVGSVAILAALAVRFQAQRDAPYGRSWLLTACALLAAVATALPFIALEGRYAASQARAIAEYGEAAKPPFRPSDIPWLSEETQDPAVPTPTRYVLAVDATQPPEVRIEATVELVAGPDVPRDALVFTLRRPFEVEEVRLDGAAVPFERERDLLRIRPPQAVAPGRAFSMTAVYHGRVDDWRLEENGFPAALAGREFVYLPAGWGWYPVPGEQRLTWEIGMPDRVFRALAERSQPFNSAEPGFDVRVQAPPEVRYLAGFEKDGEGAWRLQGKRNRLTLLGGPWYERVEGAVRYAVPFEQLDSWQASGAGLQKVLDAAADWTGMQPLVMVPSPVSLYDAGEVTLLDAGPFAGEVYEPGLSDERLVWGVQYWLRDLLRFQPRNWFATTPGEKMRYVPGEALDALPAYVTAQVLDEGLGEAAAWQERGGAGASTAAVQAWAARTPPEAQKAVLRRLFHDALLRPLTREDLAFLDEGGAE